MRYPRLSINGIYDHASSLGDDVELCRQAGLGGVVVPNWKLLDAGVDGARRLFEGAGLRVPAVIHANLFALDAPDRWPAQIRAAQRTVDQAVQIGADAVYVTTGGRGQLTWAAAADAFVTAAHAVVEHAAAAGVPLLVEPNPFVFAELSILHTLADTVQVASRAGMGICLDVFGCWADSGFATHLPAAAAAAGLVQVSDYVLAERNGRERAVPGDGAIDWQPVFAALHSAGYSGWFDIELCGPLLQTEGTVAAFTRAARWIDRHWSCL